MEIKVLGTGCCSKCATLTKNAEEAVKTMGINASVEEVDSSGMDVPPVSL